MYIYIFVKCVILFVYHFIPAPLWTSMLDKDTLQLCTLAIVTSALQIVLEYSLINIQQLIYIPRSTFSIYRSCNFFISKNVRS